MANTTTNIAAQTPLAPVAPRTHPILGNLSEIRHRGLHFLTSLQRTYGDVVRYHLGFFPMHLVAHPDDLKHVLQENHKNYSKKLLTYQAIRPIVGEGLLTSDGAFWLRQRRLMQPAFHRQRIAAMGEIMTQQSVALRDDWQRVVGSGTPVDVAEAMMGMTLRIVAQALFGTNISADVATVGQSFNILNEQLSERFKTLRLLPPILPTANDRAYRNARTSLTTVVASIIEQRRRNPSESNDLLSMLMDAQDEDTGERMTDAQLRDEVMTLMLAGHETTATALTWTWALLAQHPEVEATLHAEVDSVLDGVPPTMADLSKLQYTRMVIEEAMRLYPPIFIVSRKAEQDDIIGRFRIPKGTGVAISPYVTHRHPSFWENPDTFDPTRFTPERSAGRPRFAYLPFIGGPRQCIGNTFAMAEAQIILATLAQRYRLRVAPGHVVAPEPLITLRSRGGMPMIVEQR